MEVTFSKYMQPDTVALTLTAGGRAVDCTVSWPTHETAADGTVYAKTFTLTPAAPLAEESTVSVSVTADALSYAGTAAKAGSMDARVGGAPKLIVRKNVQVLCGGSVKLPITVKNVENPVITAVSGQSALVGASVDGSILTLQGLLPGTVTVTVSVAGTDLTETMEVQVRKELVVNPDSISDAVRSGSTVTATVTCADGGYAAAAVDGDREQFLGVKLVPVSPGENQTVTLPDLPEGGTCKVFLLSSTYAPLTEAVPVK